MCGPAAAAAGCVNKGNLQLPFSIVTGSPGTSNSYHTCPQPAAPLEQKPQYFYFDHAKTGLQCKDRGSIGGVLNPGFEQAVDGSKLAGHFSPDAAVLSVALYTVYGGSGRGCKLSMCTNPSCSAGHQFRLQFEHRTDTGCDFSNELKVQEYGHVKSTSWVLHSRGATLSHCPRISVVRYRGFNLCPPGVEACGPAASYHKCVNPFTQKLINSLKHNDGDAKSTQTCKEVPDWKKVPQKFSYSTNWDGAKAFCEGKGMRLPCASELCSSPDNFAPGVAACDGRGGLPSGGATKDKWTPVMDKVKGSYGEVGFLLLP